MHGMNEIASAAEDGLSLAHHYLAGLYSWAPAAASACLLVGAALILWRGAQLAPLIAAGVGVYGGSELGAALSGWFGWPMLPTAIAAAIVGGAFGIVLTKVLVAAFLGLCAALVGVGVYAGQVLYPVYLDYARGEDLQVSLPAADAAPAGNVLWVVPQGLWDYLNANTTALQFSLGVITLATLGAGLAFGMLMPRLARAVTAATAGAMLLVIGLFSASELTGMRERLLSLGPWTWAALAVVWAIALLSNYFRSGRRRSTDDRGEAGLESTTATA